MKGIASELLAATSVGSSAAIIATDIPDLIFAWLLALLTSP